MSATHLHVVILCRNIFVSATSCVLCYKCFAEDTYYDANKLLCKHFDGSDKYVENCSKSTMCFKRVTTLSLGNGSKFNQLMIRICQNI